MRRSKAETNCLSLGTCRLPIATRWLCDDSLTNAQLGGQYANVYSLSNVTNIGPQKFEGLELGPFGYAPTTNSSYHSVSASQAYEAAL